MNVKRLISLFLCVGGLLSCAKEVAFEEENIPLRDGYKWLDVSLAMENTKTIISGAGSTKSIEWVQGDRIDFFWGSESDAQSTITVSVGGATANLRVQIPEEVTEVYAAYPSGAATFADGTLSFEMPGVESGEFSKVNFMASKIEADSDGKKTAVFRSVVSFLKFTISDPDAQKIEIRTRAEENPVLRGTIPVTFDTDGNIVVGDATDTHQSYTMNIAGTGDFYAPVLPGKVYADGFELNYYVNNLNTKYYDVEFDFKLDRGYIASFGTVETLFTANTVHSYYVTVSGAGSKDGSSWSNALGKDEFKEKITRISDDTDTDVVKAAESYLKNALFHIEGGTYDLGELVELGFSNHCKKYINFVFDGGYFNGSKDVQNHPTVFDGGNSHRIFELARYADLAVMDCTFSHSSGSSGGEAAIRTSSKYSKLTLSGCSFIDNANTATGSAVNVGFGTASISNCTFSGNTATIGAAINVNNGGDSDIDVTGQVTVTGCTFDGNTTTSTSDGGAVKIQAGGPIMFSGCTFTGNTNTGGYGAAVFVIDARETLTFTDCAFGVAGNGNTSAKSGGAIRFNNGAASAEFNNCSFADNSTGSYGGAISLASSFTGTVRINGGSISNCSAPSQEGGAISQDAGTLIVDGLAINGCSSKYGGAYATAGGTARFTNCNFGRTSRNTATQRGGCIYSNNVAVTSDNHTFTDCWISGQVSSGGDEVTGGGARFGSGASPLFTRCTFDNCNSTTTTTDNEGQKSGAGAVHIASSHPSFVNCTFSNCTTVADVEKNGNGGAIKISNSNSHPSFSGCTFTNCESHYRGGAIYSEASTSSGINITDCEFTECYSPDEGGALDVRNSCTYNITDCNFHDNYGPWGTIYVGSKSTVNLVGGNMTENIGKTGASGSYQVGAAIYGSANSKVTCDGVVFDGNEAKEGPLYHCGSNNDITAWFNSCVIRNNHWTATYGCLFNMPSGKTGVDIAFNNCSFFDNYLDGSTENRWQSCWFNLNNFTGKILFTNSTMWGFPAITGTVKDGKENKTWGFLRFNTTSTGEVYLVNDVFANTQNGGRAFTMNQSYTLNTDYSVLSNSGTQANNAVMSYNGEGNITEVSVRGTAGTFTFTKEDDYIKITSLNGVANGFVKQSTETINGKIRSANSDFYDWLNSIGALGKDCRGKTRNSSANWPGAYDKDAN